MVGASDSANHVNLLRIIDTLDVRAELDRFIDETLSRREKLRAQVDIADEFLELRSR